MNHRSFERRHGYMLPDLLPDLETLIGPRSMALLESCRKLEMEGACNFGTYKKDHGKRLIKLLDDKAERLIRDDRKPKRSRAQP